MSITTVTCEKQAVHNNPREEIAKVNKKPIEYLYNYIKQINNDVLPQFNTTISHVTRDTVYYTVAICKIGNLRYGGIGGTCLSAKMLASIKALKSLTRKTK